MVKHSGPTRLASSGDGLLPYLLLVLLALAAAGVLLKQSDFNPAVLYSGTASHLELAAERGSGLAALRPSGLNPLGPAQVYNPKNLFHKINGKADLYLTAGFERLTTRRFGLASDGDIWCEAFAYEMKTPEAAFAVYSQQRRPEGKPFALTGSQAYVAGNALYLAKGKLYLELVGGSVNQDLLAGMQAMAASLAGEGGKEAKAPVGGELFPQKGRKPGSLTLHPKGAFGYGGFGPVYTMNFAGGSEGLTAFAAVVDSPERAQALKQAYAKFLLENGGKRLEKPGLPPGMEVLDMLGAYEVLFVQGNALAGVHDSLDPAPALALAKEMSAAREASK